MEFIAITGLLIKYLAALSLFVHPGANTVPGSQSGLNKYSLAK